MSCARAPRAHTHRGRDRHRETERNTQVCVCVCVCVCESEREREKERERDRERERGDGGKERRHKMTDAGTTPSPWIWSVKRLAVALFRARMTIPDVTRSSRFTFSKSANPYTYR